MKKIAARSPGFERRLHRRRGEEQIVKPLRCLVDFDLRGMGGQCIAKAFGSASYTAGAVL
jgi:hypothetical protein